MIIRKKKTTTKLAAIWMMGLVLMTGCSTLSGSDTEKDTQNTTAIESNSENSLETNSESSSETRSQSSDAQAPLVIDSGTESSPSDQNQSSEAKDSSFETYMELLGLSKQDFLYRMNEKPETIDEGGLEFKEAGIRVWFDMETSVVSQIYFDRNDMDFNGARIGDKIESFKTAFGEPVSDKNGDMHFNYKDRYISVNYDAQIQTTVAVYLLSEEIQEEVKEYQVKAVIIDRIPGWGR